MFIFVTGVCAILTIASTGSQSQPAQPRFTSGGIQVVANRAVLSRDEFGARLVVSLVLTNLGDDDLAIDAPEYPTVIADTGGDARADRLSGIAMSGCGESAAFCSPTMIERQNSITVTMLFRFRSFPDNKVCSVDFSMPVFIRRGSDRGRDNWRRITVGLPNVMVC
jgi:hypothetical protein